MPKYLLSIEFESIREHAILFRSMCESSAKALVATNGLKGLGPIEIVALQDNIESQKPSANTPIAFAAQIARSLSWLSMCVKDELLYDSIQTKLVSIIGQLRNGR